MIKQMMKNYQCISNMGFVLVCSAMLLCAVVLPGSASAAQNEVVVTGYGENRNAAIQDALRSAVAQVVGVFLKSKTLVKDLVVQADLIHTSSHGFIKSYKVVKEKPLDIGYDVDLLVYVEPDKEKVIKQMRSLIFDRSFTVDHISVRQDGRSINDKTLDHDLNNALNEAGYYVVTPEFGDAFYSIRGTVDMRKAHSQFASEDMKVYELSRINIKVAGDDGVQLFRITERDVKDDVVESGATASEAVKAAVYQISPAIVDSFLTRMRKHKVAKKQ
ncbi:hypothetical protein D8Y20_13270 [Mariprofundus sp. EBB-1]|uniref:hypothetical protein n=1 Tax=Mariprofundus sp. EBB-1 TaxID=2650971 RepID=UPI000EF1BC80|nr:hypothetical protein [Mariprofundus sp. EBB-1]RLL49146.1 hypothetical protein D8Y20_13270 [Mariprofundus sp. EBB-1]